uniref:Uncharacterized protein n=1 Tax=Myotis myotis TaxID=51298 RepID=A0A7J7R0B6_MYOMY|nr:hypothetical protein mMyoMyo1_011239 [Myotis myotis]
MTPSPLWPFLMSLPHSRLGLDCPPPPVPHYPSGEDIQAPPGNSLSGSTRRPLLTRGGELPGPWVTSLPLAQPLTCPPPEAALRWRGPHPPQRLLWAGRQLLTSPGPSVTSSAGLSLGRPSWTAMPCRCPHQGHLWGARSSSQLEKRRPLLHLPHAPRTAPRAFGDLPTPNAQFAPNFLCT